MDLHSETVTLVDPFLQSVDLQNIKYGKRTGDVFHTSRPNQTRDFGFPTSSFPSIGSDLFNLLVGDL